MTENTCPFGDDREEHLLAYLYDEVDLPARKRFDAHLANCAVCRDELAGFRAVRTQLASWTPPAFSRRSSAAGPQPSAVDASRQSWWHAVPAWAQVAAALVFLGVSAGIANLNIHYDQSGLTVRTGWSTPAAASAATMAGTGRAASAASTASPWRSDLTALERQLRSEFHANGVAAQPAHSPSADVETLRRVRAMIDESERKQQRDLALRVAEVMRDVDVQRRADLTRISQSLGQIQSNTGMEVMKQRQLLNYLVTVSQKQP